MRAIFILLIGILGVGLYLYINDNERFNEQLHELNITIIDEENDLDETEEANEEEDAADEDTEEEIEEDNESGNGNNEEGNNLGDEENEKATSGMTGIHEWVGNNIGEVREYYGEPDRIDLSPYGYEWWIYNDAPYYIQIGVKNENVVTVFTNDQEADTYHVNVGDKFTEAKEHFTFEESVSLNESYTSYQFELSKDDMEMRPMTEIDGVWVQYYIDIVEGTISSIRYTDVETLVLHRPYSIVYRGELPEADPLSDEEWERVQEGQARQIFDLTNHIREHHGLQALEWEEDTAYVAYLHSKDMYTEDYFSHTSPNHGELQHRLEAKNVNFHIAAENIAARYVDGIAAVEGWLNSEGHRVNLLNDEFTHLGVGVHRDFYTQNFLTP